MRYAVIGDTHIPERAEKIPQRFIDMIKERAPDKIIATGDFTEPDTLNKITELGETIAVRGNMDEFELPAYKFFSDETAFVLVTHGTGIMPRGDTDTLVKIAKDAGANIIVTGHTHILEVKFVDGVLIVNPGSATGAWGGGGGSEKESMLFMHIEKNKVSLFMFEGDKSSKAVYKL
ncbi:MAG: YfcE family phosphodiesterase [Candidatus Diapherotrites archaeon]|nr:YfcE family phosphodiesterase [Candidatus Diapherotrites archaeon]